MVWRVDRGAIVSRAPVDRGEIALRALTWMLCGLIGLACAAPTLEGKRTLGTEARRAALREQGMPNYFGAQRFGHAQGNLAAAERWFAGQERPPKRHLQGLYLSAARALLFNQVLAERVRQGSWNTAVGGDVFMLDGAGSWFVDDGDAGLPARLAAMDIHPSGPLWGQGESPARDAALALEQAQLQPFARLRQGLAQHGLKQERRSLRCRVDDLTLEVLAADCLQLQFSLPAGSYATVVLAQLGDFASR
ncbi:MAG TPA: tRNA pseudouridine(13) synthase TruD [Thiolinea sp.]|nr:tRNA pseudouridine(13) synthase TruD [Thiolinea sp.]